MLSYIIAFSIGVFFGMTAEAVQRSEPRRVVAKPSMYAPYPKETSGRAVERSGTSADGDVLCVLCKGG